MSVEIAEVANFLERTAPFASLIPAERSALSRTVTVRYARTGDSILTAGDHNDSLFVIRSGAVELRLAGKDLTARLEEGSTFAYPSLLRGGEVRNTTIALEDTLLYAIPAERFHELRKQSPDFREFFAADEAARIRHALARLREGSSFALDDRQVGNLVGRSTPVSCIPSTQIADAVQLMHQRNVSTLAVCEDGKLEGIFTDKDLRSRVVAGGVALDREVGDVMTTGPQTLGTNATVAEAMALMASGGFRHIPLIDSDGALAGILSATDILGAIGNNAIDTGLMIAKARTPDELIEAAARVPESFARMVSTGVQAGQAMRFTSALGEAVHRRAAQLAEEALGPPPCPYALVVFGSLAREEQLVGSDQDNGLVIAEELDPAGEAYFADLGTRISDQLDASGYVYCSGGIMAKNADQRLTLAAWRARYANWINSPSEDKILRATIFFDMRCVHGDAGLVAELRKEVLALLFDSPLFISYLARDALRSKVPLGVFRNLVLDKTEDGQMVFNAKKQAIMPIIDIARTQALATGVPAVGTIGRLRALCEAGKMNSDDTQSLEDALLFVNELRIAHQARQIERGEAPDNLIAPADLSPLERDYLKDALTVVRRGLDALRRNFAGGIV
ncbi:putative nucleotidyltransferase substrate binding domain-containing protein [Pontixanthobacter aestiaquae]|nr:putative nucleotidyltransferase substrate binding domain-containing protein [Pontixanthobacter aestiaquae]MDN3644639.1 putative nucleotidyltransferase substrate binding domain-containing protein [Pontixanthobacter aestiaquae]